MHSWYKKTLNNYEAGVKVANARVSLAFTTASYTGKFVKVA
jgi:hypothetical protein